MTVANRILFASALAGLCTLLPAVSEAATPVLSGAYAYSATMSCQARVTWTTGNAVRSVTSGPVLTGAVGGNAVGTLITGQAVIDASLGTAVISVDFGTSQAPTGQVVVGVTTGMAVVDSISTPVVASTTTGTGLVSATSGPVVLTYAIVDNDAQVQETVGTWSFNSSTHKLNVVEKTVAGTLLRKGNGTATDADALKKTNHSASNLSYANDASTFTLHGVAHNAVYANIVSGVARHVNFLRLDANGCAFRGTLVRQ